MCLRSVFGGSQPRDNSAEILAEQNRVAEETARQQAEQRRQEEEARQARIREGQGAIDSNFAQFDDGFYRGVEGAYTDYYMPQLEDQFGKARDKLMFALARSGNLNASAGASQLGELQERRNQQALDIANQAGGQATALRGNVERTRGELASQNAASADPTVMTPLAMGRATELRAPQPLSPMGQIFADLVNTTATGVDIERQGYGPGFGLGIGPKPPLPTGKGSARIH